jgi:nitrite reductase/ring-hydroxylating ferredoxin subunit
VVANVADIPSGGGLIVNGPDGSPLILAEHNGTVVGHSAICTHQGAEIGGDGVCPRHGSVFDIVTGAVLNGPATSPLPEVTVTVFDGKVYAS